MFRLKMILRLLQMSSFNGKMSALNEINQLISTISQQPKPEWLTPAVITVSIETKRQKIPFIIKKHVMIL